jgi:hypothetical protein
VGKTVRYFTESGELRFARDPSPENRARDDRETGVGSKLLEFSFAMIEMLGMTAKPTL